MMKARKRRDLACAEVRKRAHKYFGLKYDTMSELLYLDEKEEEHRDRSFENSRLKLELLGKKESKHFQKQFKIRRKLPVMQKGREILNAIKRHQVILVVGHRGCGKTTQIVQLLMDDFVSNSRASECRIACVQTCTDNAVKAGELVAFQRDEELGHSIGIVTKQYRKPARENGCVVFCTPGVFVKHFITDPFLKTYSAVILDDMDKITFEYTQVMGILEIILPFRPDFKVILLSPDACRQQIEHFKHLHTLNIDEDNLERHGGWYMGGVENTASTSGSVAVNKTRPDDEFSTFEKKQQRTVSDIDLQVAIVDYSDPDGCIKPARWLLLEERLLTEMISDKWSDEVISFDGAEWSQGIKVIKCANKKSLEFLKATIPSIGEVWPRSQLGLIAQSALPLRIYVKMWIPPPVPATRDVFELLGKQNEGLVTQDWQIISTISCKNNIGMTFRLAIDGNSWKRLKECSGRARFGFGFISIQRDLTVK